MLTLLSCLLNRRRRTTAAREILSLARLDHRILRDIVLQRIDLYAGPVENLVQAPPCRLKTPRWSRLASWLRRAAASRPVPCC